MSNIFKCEEEVTVGHMLEANTAKLVRMKIERNVLAKEIEQIERVMDMIKENQAALPRKSIVSYLKAFKLSKIFVIRKNTAYDLNNIAEVV